MGNAYHSIGEYQKAINCHKTKHSEIVDGLGTKVELEELAKIWETIITVFAYCGRTGRQSCKSPRKYGKSLQL